MSYVNNNVRCQYFPLYLLCRPFLSLLLSHAGEDDVYTQDNSGNSFSNVFWLVVQNLVNFSTTRQLRQLVLKRLLYSDFRLVVQNLVNFSTTRLVLNRLLYSD